MPTRFEQIPGWFDFADIYDQAVEESQDGARFLEIGVWKGRSLCYLAERIQESGKRIECIGVDPFPLFGQLEKCIEHLCAAEIYRQITLFPASSAQAADNLQGSFDFVFIDGSHEEDDVWLDLSLWWPRVRPGGVVAGHDYLGMFAGVRRSVDRFFGEKNSPVVPRGNSWWVRKQSGHVVPGQHQAGVL